MAQIATTLGVMPDAFVFVSNVAANDTVVIGNITYKFVAAPSAAYDVDIGGDLATSIANLVAAINASGTAGTEYAAGTLINPYVSAAGDATTLDLTARLAGSWVNGLYLAATSPGGNSITADAVNFGSGDETGFVAGAGGIAEWVDDFLARNQVNSEVIAGLRALTAAAD